MDLGNVRIVMISPLYGGNVGSACRAMANMGISDLVIAAPGEMNMDEALMMACAAGKPILESRRECPSLAEAAADCGLVMGATARPGLYRAHAKTPRELAPAILETSTASKVALVFGREDRGMTNEEIALCTQLIRIPSASENKSLNVAQAIMICCYEIYTASGMFVAPEEPSEEAPSDLRERMFGMWRKALLDVGFMGEDKAAHMMLGLRRILSRGRLTRSDIKIMMGIARQTSWAVGGGGKGRSAGRKGGENP